MAVIANDGISLPPRGGAPRRRRPGRRPVPRASARCPPAWSIPRLRRPSLPSAGATLGEGLLVRPSRRRGGRCRPAPSSQRTRCSLAVVRGRRVRVSSALGLDVACGFSSRRRSAERRLSAGPTRGSAAGLLQGGGRLSNRPPLGERVVVERGQGPGPRSPPSAASPSPRSSRASCLGVAVFLVDRAQGQHHPRTGSGRRRRRARSGRPVVGDSVSIGCSRAVGAPDPRRCGCPRRLGDVRLGRKASPSKIYQQPTSSRPPARPAAPIRQGSPVEDGPDLPRSAPTAIGSSTGADASAVSASPASLAKLIAAYVFPLALGSAARQRRVAQVRSAVSTSAGSTPRGRPTVRSTRRPRPAVPGRTR